MSRLTITLSEKRYLALKEASARRNKTIGQLIEESLEHYGIKCREDARALVARAREHAGLSEAEAMALALKETRAARGVARRERRTFGSYLILIDPAMWSATPM